MTKKSKHTYDNQAVFQAISAAACAQGLARLNQISQRIGISTTLLAGIKYGSCSLGNSHRATAEKIASFVGVPVQQLQRLNGQNGAIVVTELTETARYVALMREKLVMNKGAAAAFFGLGKNAFIEYELDRRKAPLLLLLILKLVEDYPDSLHVVTALANTPDPRQTHPTYFSYMRRKLKIRKRDAAHLFDLGKSTFSQIESGKRKPSLLLCMIFKLIEHRPALFPEIQSLSQAVKST